LTTKNTKFLKGCILFNLILGITISSSCSKINDSTEMNIIVSPSPVAYDIPIITSLDTGTVIATIPVRLNLNDMIKLHNERFSSNDVKSANLNSMTLTITDKATDVTFANFENLRVTIQGGNESSRLLASLNPTDSQVKTLNIPLTATVNDLKSIIANGMVNYIIKGKLRRATTKIYAISASASYRLQLEL
jgi:hypothetical protein